MNEIFISQITEIEYFLIKHNNTSLNIGEVDPT